MRVPRIDKLSLTRDIFLFLSAVYGFLFDICKEIGMMDALPLKSTEPHDA